MEAKKRQALGLIETVGYAPLVAAVDSCLKAASVRLNSRNFGTIGGGLVIASIEGDIGSVSAALSVAQATIESQGALGMTHLIPRPDPSIWEMIGPDGFRDDDPEPTPGQGSKGEVAASAAVVSSAENPSPSAAVVSSAENPSPKAAVVSSAENPSPSAAVASSSENPKGEVASSAAVVSSAENPSIAPTKKKASGQNFKKVSPKVKKSRKPN